LVEVLNCALKATKGGVCGAPTVEGIRVLRSDRDSLLVVLEGAVIFAIVVVGVAPILWAVAKSALSATPLAMTAEQLTITW
jgi:hypothetical protein